MLVLFVYGWFPVTKWLVILIFVLLVMPIVWCVEMRERRRRGQPGARNRGRAARARRGLRAGMVDEEQEEGARRRSVDISKMPHLKFDPAINQSEEFCPICLDSFREKQGIIPLPCDERHYFHEACIKKWLETNVTCPLCNSDIGEDSEPNIND